MRNSINAIEQGIITASTKQRLSALEEEKARLEQSIIEVKIQNPALSREQITFFLDQFKHTDTTDEEQRQRLIDSFVNAVYVFDDKIVLIFNYKNGTKTISLDTVKSSDLVGGCPPAEALEPQALLVIGNYCRRGRRDRTITPSFCISWSVPR